jgi:hypothetical protein
MDRRSVAAKRCTMDGASDRLACLLAPAALRAAFPKTL